MKEQSALQKCGSLMINTQRSFTDDKDLETKTITHRAIAATTEAITDHLTQFGSSEELYWTLRHAYSALLLKFQSLPPLYADPSEQNSIQVMQRIPFSEETHLDRPSISFPPEAQLIRRAEIYSSSIFNRTEANITFYGQADASHLEYVEMHCAKKGIVKDTVYKVEITYNTDGSPFAVAVAKDQGKDWNLRVLNLLTIQKSNKSHLSMSTLFGTPERHLERNYFKPQILPSTKAPLSNHPQISSIKLLKK